MVLLSAVALGSTTAPLLGSRASAMVMSAEISQPSFKRGSDLLQIGDQVSARQIVNVLGRWQSHEEWDTIGTAGKLDDLTSGDFYEEDLEVLKTDFSKGEVRAS
jgi:hypothetical protein